MAPAFGFGFSSATGRGSAVKPNGSPSNLVLTAITDTTAAGTFTSTSTNQDGYKLFKSTDGITYTEHSAVTFGTLSFAATGLISGTKYWLYVCAYKGSALSTASNDVVIEAETTTYYARVVADGGTLIDASKVNEDLTAIKAIDETASIVMLMSGHGGMKRNDNGGLIETSKLYDYFNSSVDSSQATSANRPISALLSNSIHNLFFGPELTNKRLIHSPILSSNYTAFYVLQKGIAGPATAAEYFHAGNISGGAIGFMSNYYYESVGITSYM